MIFFILFFVFFFLPHSAWAWGPIAHLDYASEALSNVAAYGGAVKLLLEKFPYDFLYGTLAADITLGKDYVDYVYNCHNWRVGFLILNEAKDDRQKAAALGYLSHLAVDIISHNYFVPYKTIRSYSTRTLGHVYWEVRFDANLSKTSWNLAQKMSRMKFPHDDELFEKMVTRTIFSFRTNKRIFRSVLNLHRLGQWKRMIQKVHDVSRFSLSRKDIEDYRSLAIESVLKFLKNPDDAPCTRVDPTGADKLRYADEMRKELKTLSKKKIITTEIAEKFLKAVKPALRETIYHSGELPVISDFL